jgi:hypothetical protein
LLKLRAENNSTSVTPPPNDDGGGGCRGRGSLPCPAIIGIIVGGVVFIIIVVIIIVIVIRLLTKKSIGIGKSSHSSISIVYNTKVTPDRCGAVLLACGLHIFASLRPNQCKLGSTPSPVALAL